MYNEDCCKGCIGYAYVPIQTLDKIYDAEDALCKASLFPELVIDMKDYGKVCTQVGGIE